MTSERPFCPGYDRAPFDALVAGYPGADVYPAKDFRLEWGPIFHRGGPRRLGPAARPGPGPGGARGDRRRILVGEAGQRVQGLLAKVGITSSYAMVNTFLYSVYGQGGGSRHERRPGDRRVPRPLARRVADRHGRHRRRHARLAREDRLGHLGGGAARRRRRPARGRRPAPDLARELLPRQRHSPRRGHGGPAAGLERAPARPARRRDDPTTPCRSPSTATRGSPATSSASRRVTCRRAVPAWWRSLEPWADRTGPDAETKRATVTVTVPTDARPWH